MPISGVMSRSAKPALNRALGEAGSAPSAREATSEGTNKASAPARVRCVMGNASLFNPELVVREGLESIFRDQIVPLVAHSALVLDIQAGLDGDDVARHQ